ncbi:YitT family protein [Clostridium aminobutyricum]|uniref:YitT family protein n=1 Tax=Clostridium aminobutyricum TaxID=33953 RepID=A0A939IG85_CLOAM|nr:YitT family protein [Clostridium aminobutyricum]MBN7772855.1 YitT family protein [Clostridium aminobutyricum]
MKKITKERVKQVIIDLAFILIACCIGAFATVSILIPNGLSSGGVTGAVRILQNYVSLDFSIMYYIGALVILVICTITLGMKEGKKILLLTIMYPAALMVFEQFNFQLLEQKDIILAAIYCGIFSGICNGIGFSRGYSFGGTDTIAKIIQKKILPHVSLSKILMAIDTCVIVASGFVFGRNIALYALITTIIISKMTDYVLFGFETKIVQVEIITSASKEIADYIMNDIERGVSIERITGAYTRKERDKLQILCSPREGILIRQKVARLDPKALVTVIHVDSVWGNGIGFNDIEKE